MTVQPKHRAYIRIDRKRAASTEGAVVFVASSDIVARDGMVIDQGSWRLDNYATNPVILWCHDYSKAPVGRAARVWLEERRLMIEVVFDEASEHGATVARQVRDRFLNAVSVGWGDAQYLSRSALDKSDPYYLPEGGILVRFPELLEVSVVPVPADPSAVATSRAFLDSLEEWVRANVPESDDEPESDEVPVDDLPWLTGEDEALPALPWLKG